MMASACASGSHSEPFVWRAWCHDLELPEDEARYLLLELVRQPPTGLLAPFHLSAGQRQRLDGWVARRRRGEPLQYITGRAHFLGEVLRVGPGVLIPRPETELLVEAALRHLPPGARLLDLGTGSGCIGLAIARQRADVTVVATDREIRALRWARLNDRQGHLDLRRGDLYAPVVGEQFDVICANPPYVAEGDILPSDVRGFEPPAALFADDDGLACIRRVIAGAPTHLRPGGRLLMEIGATQGEAVRDLATAVFAEVTILRDHAGLDRLLVGVRD
jgi:release factor glutamine methyltransferase